MMGPEGHHDCIRVSVPGAERAGAGASCKYDGGASGGGRDPAYFFGEENPDLDARVTAAVEAELDRIIVGDEGIWFNQERAGITIAELFEPLPDAEPQPEQLTAISEALAANIDRPRQSGHNVIFASIALRTLKDHSEYATPAVVDGIRRLIAGFNGVVPGRGYYGRERGWISGDAVSLPEEADVQPSAQWSAHLTHRIKTLYGFHTLLRYVDDEETRATARGHSCI